MAFDTGWWWDYQNLISEQFGFSHIREEVASRLASRILVQEGDIANHFRDRDMTVVGAGILPSTKIPESNLVVADGALRACLEREVVPDFVVTDFDGYVSDVIWAGEHGSKVVVHCHGDNMATLYQYSSRIRLFVNNRRLQFHE